MPSKYTRSDRYKAAAAMVSYGNSLVVSAQTGIPGSTLRHWHRNDEEFQTMCQELWVEFGEEIKATLAQIVRESGEQVLDRLRGGDTVRDPKTGGLARVPMRGKDIAICGAVAFDKLRLAESQPTQIDRLAEQFRAISDQH